MAVWYSLWSFVIFFPIWYAWTKKNPATLVKTNVGILFRWKAFRRQTSRLENNLQESGFYFFIDMFSEQIIFINKFGDC
jgi:hypothetical protein